MNRLSKKQEARHLWKPHIFKANGIWFFNPANHRQTISYIEISRMKEFNVMALDFVNRRNFSIITSVTH